jgi:hypothetical protein
MLGVEELERVLREDWCETSPAERDRHAAFVLDERKSRFSMKWSSDRPQLSGGSQVFSSGISIDPVDELCLIQI